MKKLEEYVRSIPDFPEPGIIFRDITSLLQDADGLHQTIDMLGDTLKDVDFDVVVGPESRGFIFGVPVAYNFHKAFVPIRKKGKLPRATIDVDYELEYGTSTLCVHKDDIGPQDRLVILDDILATGGTAEAMCKIAESAGAKVACCAFFMEIDFLKGRKRLEGRTVVSMFVK